MIAGAADVAVVGAVFPGAVRLADAAVHVEHNDGSETAAMNPINPGAREVCQGGEVFRAGQPARLEPVHLACEGRPAIQPAALGDRPHRRIMRQTISVVHILISRETTKHLLPQQPGHQMPGAPAVAAFL